MLGNETTSRLAIKLALPATIIIAVISVIVGVFTAQTIIARFKSDADKERGLKAHALADNLVTTRRVMLERSREAMRIINNTANSKKMSVAPSVQIGEKTIPNLMLDNVSLVNNDAFADDLAARTGATVSVFVRDKDDAFVNISTTAVKSENVRATGETIEKSNAVANDMRQGATNYNISYINNRAFLRHFEPIKESGGGRVVGAWSTAYPILSLTDLGKDVAEQKILTDGFVALVDPNGKLIAKSTAVSEDVIEAAVKTNFNGSSASPVGGWSVIRQDVADWNGYAVYAGYSNADPQITGELSRIMLWTILTALVVSMLLGGIIVFIAMRITARLEEAVEAADRLAEGDLDVELKVTSNDEVGRLQKSMLKMLEYLRETAAQADQIAAGDLTVKVVPRSPRDRFGIALKNMLDNVLSLVQSQDERDKLQGSIMKLLEEVADVAEGDLTGHAEVTSDATGAIADAFNFMIDELRTVVRRVKDAATQVGTGAGDIRATTDKLAEGSAVQAHQIAITSNAVEEITASIREVSASAAESATVANNALASAHNGKQAVSNNIAAMTKIRGQVQETAKRIKKLGERSQEIDEIVGIIDELADRTSLLALNAALQAAAAGEAGRGFATVAEEVERLADRSGAATQRIAQLTRTIQLETKDVLASMEDTIREVVDGSQLANEAGNALQEIEQVSNNLAGLIQNISQTARRQAIGSESIARSMNDISQITELVASESKHTASSVKGLVSLTEKLRGSVATFKLPANLDKTGTLPDLSFINANANGNGNGNGNGNSGKLAVLTNGNGNGNGFKSLN